MDTCSHCGYESRGTATCPLCGGTMSVAEAAPDPAVPPPAGLPAWEDPAIPFPRDLLHTWVRSLARPTDLFRRVPWDAAAARPILYFLIIAIVTAFFTLWWEAVLGRSDVWPLLAELGIAPAVGGAASVLRFFFAPFAALVWLVVSSLLFHAFVLMLSPERRGFRATLRVACYAAGPGVLAIVPFVGPLVGGVWSLVLIGIGLREAHRMTGGAAAVAVILAVLAPALLFVGMLFLAIFAGVLVR